jgi:hypothetical protein
MFADGIANQWSTWSANNAWPVSSEKRMRRQPKGWAGSMEDFWLGTRESNQCPMN